MNEKKRVIVQYFFVVFLLFFSGHSFGESLKSPFNNLTLAVDSKVDYRFIVSGHFFGDGTNNSQLPANTLLANVDWINDSGASLLICLGDLFKDVSRDMPGYEKYLFRKLTIPLFNSVGNHDLTDDIYQQAYGETYFSFLFKNDLHIVLDTEMDDGHIREGQLEFLKKLGGKVSQGKVQNVFIYGHRTIWKDSYRELNELFNSNTRSIEKPNFEQVVLPVVNEMGRNANVYFFSGSLGPAPASFFYFADKNNNITYIVTSIRSFLRDAVLIVNSNNGEVSFDTRSLTGQDVMPLENYNVDYWLAESQKLAFDWRRLPDYLRGVLEHSYFWYGAAFASLSLTFAGYLFNLVRLRFMHE